MFNIPYKGVNKASLSLKQICILRKGFCEYCDKRPGTANVGNFLATIVRNEYFQSDQKINM
jgi:hypothetical protein